MTSQTDLSLSRTGDRVGIPHFNVHERDFEIIQSARPVRYGHINLDSGRGVRLGQVEGMCQGVLPAL